MRKSTQVAHCCATYTIEGFPSNMDVDDRYVRAFGTPESFQKEVNRHIEKAHYQNKSLIVCTVNTHQTRAEEWLREMGFISSG